MDKDFKDVITYGLGTIVGYSTFIGTLVYFFKEDWRWILVYLLIITIILWNLYLHVKITKTQGGKKKND